MTKPSDKCFGEVAWGGALGCTPKTGRHKLQEASALPLVQVPGLLPGKRSSSVTKRFVRFWSLCKFPKLVVIVLSLFTPIIF